MKILQPEKIKLQTINKKRVIGFANFKITIAKMVYTIIHSSI